MDLKRLKHLVALADQRNFARAAQRVHLSQPAFSRSIQAIEAELGIRLFDRGTTEATPTPAGSFIIERARKLVFEASCLDRDIALYRGQQLGDLAFGLGPFPAATFLPTLLPELRKQHPGIQIRVEVSNTGHLAQSLRMEQLDFFVADIRDLPSSVDLEVRQLARQSAGFFVRAGHPLAGGGPVDPAVLESFGLATVRPPRALRSAVSRALGMRDGSLPIALECDDVQTLKRAALASDTILCVVRAAVLDEIASGQLLGLEMTSMPPLFAETGIVSLRGRSHSPMAVVVVERLQVLALQFAGNEA